MTKFIHRHTINMGLIVGFDNGNEIAFNCINIVSTINPNPAAKKYSLSFLTQKCGISTSAISTEYNKIKNFYDKNQALKRTIINS